MGMIDYINNRIRKMDIVDLKLAQTGGAFFALIIAKIFPRIMEINIWWFVALGILSMLKPWYAFWIKK